MDRTELTSVGKEHTVKKKQNYILKTSLKQFQKNFSKCMNVPPQ